MNTTLLPKDAMFPSYNSVAAGKNPNVLFTHIIFSQNLHFSVHFIFCQTLIYSAHSFLYQILIYSVHHYLASNSNLFRAILLYFVPNSNLSFQCAILFLSISILILHFILYQTQIYSVHYYLSNFKLSRASL